MIKTYNKKPSVGMADPNQNAANAANAGLNVFGGAITAEVAYTQSEIQGLCDAIDEQITLMCECMGCLKSRLHPVLKENEDVDLTTNWGAINKTVEIDHSSTPIGKQLEAYCARLASIITGVHMLTDRLGV